MWRSRMRTFTGKTIPFPVIRALLQPSVHSPSFQGISHADWTWKNADVPTEKKQNSSLSLFYCVCVSLCMTGTEVIGLSLHTYVAIFGIWVRLPFCGLAIAELLFFLSLWLVGVFFFFGFQSWAHNDSTHNVIIWQRLFSQKPKIKFPTNIFSGSAKVNSQMFSNTVSTTAVQNYKTNVCWCCTFGHVNQPLWLAEVWFGIPLPSSVTWTMMDGAHNQNVHPTLITPSWPSASSHHCVSVKHKLASMFSVAVGFSK